jgi:hypothetical protein
MEIPGLGAGKTPQPGDALPARPAGPGRHDQSFGDVFAKGSREQHAPTANRPDSPPRPPARHAGRGDDTGTGNPTPAGATNPASEGATNPASEGEDDTARTIDGGEIGLAAALTGAAADASRDPGPRAGGATPAGMGNADAGAKGEPAQGPSGDLPGPVTPLRAPEVIGLNARPADSPGGDPAAPPLPGSGPEMRAAAHPLVPDGDREIKAAFRTPAGGGSSMAAVPNRPIKAPAARNPAAPIESPTEGLAVVIRASGPRGPQDAAVAARPADAKGPGAPDPGAAPEIRAAPGPIARDGGAANSAMPPMPASPGPRESPAARPQPRAVAADGDANAPAPAHQPVLATARGIAGIRGAHAAPDPAIPDPARAATPGGPLVAVHPGAAVPRADPFPGAAPGTAGPAPAPPEVARIAAPQIAMAIPAGSGDGRIEVQLDPPELGRVEILLDMSDNRLRATVVAERPAIGEMMRRHADILLGQLQQAGFVDIDLQFGRGHPDPRWGAPPHPRPSGDRADARPDSGYAAPDSYSPRHAVDGLDLRL